MRPILFADNETNFTSNGLGRLDCISCIVTEERNGLYELEMQMSISGLHASEVGMNSIIGVIPCEGGSIQAFRVYEISKPINGIFTVYARHISYDLIKIPTMPFSVPASPTAAADTLAGLKTNAVEACPFTFWTDVATTSSYNQTMPASIRHRLGGVAGSVLDQFGGEFEWDNYSVKLHKQRGRIDTGITLRYGKNITDITQEENIADTITGVVPFWINFEGDTIVTLPEKAVYSQYADRYPMRLTAVLDLSQNWDEAPSENSLRLAAQAYVNKGGIGIPKISIDVSFVALWQTEEYKDIAPLQFVRLCDEVTVEFEKLGISETAKVVKTVYDVLLDRYKSIHLGSLRSTLISTLNDREASTIQTIEDTFAHVSDEVNRATAWLTGSNGYIVAVKNQDGSWKELLAMDTNDPAQAIKVMRLNENGLGGSSTGINGPYTTAILSDGTIVATRIATGILQDHYGNFVLNLDTGLLTIKGNAKVDTGDDETTFTDMFTTISMTAEGLESTVRKVNEKTASYSGDYVPTLVNYPAVDWTSEEDKAGHLNDLFINSSTGDLYMFKNFEDQGIAITFDSQSACESTAYDYVVVYYYDEDSGTYKYTNKLGGNGSSNNLAGTRLTIPSNKVYIQWHTDSSQQNFYGFSISNVEGIKTITPSTVASQFPNSTSVLPIAVTDVLSGLSTKPETPHNPYLENTNQLWEWDTRIGINGYGWGLYTDIQELSSQITQTAEQIELKVSKTEYNGNTIVSLLNLDATTATIQASKINLTGYVTFTNLSTAGETNIDGANITTGFISADRIEAGTITSSKLDNTTQEAISSARSIYGTCSTGPTTADKVVTCNGFVLFTGAKISVKFSYANTLKNLLTLNVNGTGARNIVIETSTVSSYNVLLWASGATIDFRYDGSYWIVDNVPKVLYGTSATSGSVQIKYSSITNAVVFKGTIASINFSYANSYITDVIKLNVTYNGDADSSINVYPQFTTGTNWTSGSNVIFVFDGQYWRVSDTAALQKAASVAGAVAEQQTIYRSVVSGTTSVTAPTSWVTNNAGLQNTWTTKRPIYNSSYPVLFLCTQTKTVDGTITCTTPVKDETTTVIDGGHITTGTIDASVVTVTNLSANAINGGTLKLGGASNTNGTIEAYNSSNQKFLGINNAGLYLYSPGTSTATISLQSSGTITCGAITADSIRVDDGTRYISLDPSANEIISGRLNSSTSPTSIELMSGTNRYMTLNAGRIILNANDLYIGSSQGVTGTFGDLGFTDGICTAIQNRSGKNVTIWYTGDNGGRYSLIFQGGILTGGTGT